VRDSHRHRLTAHFIVLCAVLAGAFLANRFLTPNVFWAQWPALVGGVAFAAHLIVFARGTLATMGGAAAAAASSADDP